MPFAKLLISTQKPVVDMMQLLIMLMLLIVTKNQIQRVIHLLHKLRSIIVLGPIFLISIL